MSEEKLAMPSYGRHFECIAGDCPENCCVEWIVDIDENSKKFYESAPGPVGDKIRAHLVRDEEDDETIFSLEKGMNHVKEWGIKRDEEGKAAISTFEDRSDGNALKENSLRSGISTVSNNTKGDEDCRQESVDTENNNVSPSGMKHCENDFDMNCPFQRDDGLCEIRLTYGYEHTSETCREHPEFNEEYEDFTERSFSLSCPEVARLISETPLKKDIDEDDEIILTPLVYPSAPCTSSDAVLNALARARNRFFYYFDEDEGLKKHVSDLRDAAFSLQPKLFEMDEAFAEEIPSKNKMFLESYFRKRDSKDEACTGETASDAFLSEAASDDCLGGESSDAFPSETSSDAFMGETAGLISYMLQNLDFLTARWENALKQTLSFMKDGKFSICSFEEFVRTKTQDISRVFAYFVYRYFLKAVNDCDIVKWTEFVIKCVFVPVLVSYATGMDFYRTAALFSREIEHDGDNAAMLLDLVFDE